MTGARKEILSILEKSSIPLSAAEIHRNSSRTMDVATVYRNLHFFEEQGVLESFHFTCSEKGTGKYYFCRRKPHIHFFHCSSCHRFIPLGECKLRNLEKDLEEEHNLKIDDHILYFTGLCRDCNS